MQKSDSMREASQPIDVPLIASLFASLFLIVLNFTITALASPYIVNDLGGNRSITTYALSFFGFGSAITIPLAKPLAAKFGTHRMLSLCMVAFSLTSFLNAMAPTYFFFIAARLLMGMASGPFYPLLAHSFSFLIPSHKKTVIAWIFVTILVVVPVIGASWGGIIAYLYNWRAAFFFNIITGLLLVPILKYHLKSVQIDPMSPGFDWLGWSFYTLGIFCLTFAAVTAQQLDWYRSPILIAAVLIGTPTFIYYLLRSLTHEAPVMDIRLLTKPLFALAIFCLAILFAVYFGMIVLLAIWLTLDVQFTPLWIAVLLATMGIASLFPRFILEERLGRIDPRILIAFAILILAISCFYTTKFDIYIDFRRIALSRIFSGIGLAIFLPPIFQILSQCHSPAKWVDIFVIFQSIRNIASGLGAAIFSIIWQRRTTFYHERLSETLSLQSHATDLFLKKMKILHVPADPLAKLNDLLDKRASSLALDDVFYLLGWILVGLLTLLLCTFFFKRDLFNINQVKYTP